MLKGVVWNDGLENRKSTRGNDFIYWIKNIKRVSGVALKKTPSRRDFREGVFRSGDIGKALFFARGADLYVGIGGK